ncbi:MAG: hypothetical protein MRY32_04645 [Rickettsiales bacterium]|nr:hypothetical protein [Rickettsiales bacterium]
MAFILNMLGGMMSVLTLRSSGVYRYPYRNSMEGLGGDFKRVASDISYIIAEDDEDED